MTPGARILSSGMEASLPGRPLVRVARVGGLEAGSSTASPRGLVHDPLDRDVEVVRALVVAPADVQAHPLGGHVGQRAVDRRDVPLGGLHEHVVGLVAVHDVTAHREVGGVDLQLEARVDDALVLGLHRVRERVEVLVERLVVLVGLEERDDAGRRRVHEAAGPRPRRRRRRAGARGPARAARGSRSGSGRGRSAACTSRSRPPGQPVAEGRVRVEVRRRRARDVAQLEAAEPVADVRRVADLAHLAVADEVDAGVGLVAYPVDDRAADDPLVLRGVDRARRCRS